MNPLFWLSFAPKSIKSSWLGHTVSQYPLPPIALFLHSGILVPLMAEKLDPKEIVTHEELALSSMWEMAALVEVLEKKGVLEKQDILDAIRELRQVKDGR